ncbi:hypothetical protein SAMN04488029_1264 [Reichenbachiella faecimaris]|uniref:DUF4259 domain-containing protein n=1 Tax=Reichenbachiella faecimaris TaxID=692418 RepID=A0A1W2G8S9_REIFA|nr:hypothetical protein [Reichenbachiella faecimaris]SMD32904.1 hypothetical protein SAMN04488029_1264 [Reichenbachiella faecimaris]
MGTWGTGISSNDIFEDVKYEFFELYNDGREPDDISQQLINSNQDSIKSKEDSHNFWFALGLCQWECKSLNAELSERIRDIIESGKDIELWKELGSETSELSKRQKVLEKFLLKISSEKKSAKKRVKKKFRDSLYQKGDCLTYKLENGNYGGAFVLESEQQTEYGMNLIAVTDINSSSAPTAKDFEQANVLIQKEERSPKNYQDREIISWYYAEFIKHSTTEFSVIGSLKVSINYNFDIDYTGASQWDMLPAVMNRNAAFIKERGKPNTILKLKKLRKKKWL